jgi:hypothetical protein
MGNESALQGAAAYGSTATQSTVLVSVASLLFMSKEVAATRLRKGEKGSLDAS